MVLKSISPVAGKRFCKQPQRNLEEISSGKFLPHIHSAFVADIWCSIKGDVSMKEGCKQIVDQISAKESVVGLVALFERTKLMD